uniref:Transcription repressor n=1 Tax=Davidia involucrata TaxID=16924 RepID=A0A5B6YX98_DAVIN
MGKKMKLPSLFKSKETRHPWQWPSCNHPKTLSFRARDDMFFNPVITAADGVETPKSWFTNSSESTGSFSTESDDSGGEPLEVIIRGVRSSERLFFEPGDTSSILEDAKAAGGFPFKESVVLAMESEDPYMDFRRSMEEMVGTYGLKEWEGLEELLGWYLRMNGKMNHGFIVGAFVDLLLGIASSSSSDSTSYSSAASSFSSPSSPLSPLGQKEIDEEDKMVIS